MREILINQIAGFVLSLLSVNPQGDHLAIAVIDFNTNEFKSAHIIHKKIVHQPQKPVYFDLASLTKSLTLASGRLKHPELFDDEDVLLLNHRGGLPPVFKVVPGSNSWRSEVESLKVKQSPVHYSDTSAVRLMLNLEKKNINIQTLSNDWLDREVVYWKNLTKQDYCATTGKRNKHPIKCAVHDPLAFNIDSFVTNAGLFGTVDGVARTLINLNQGDSPLNKIMSKQMANAKNRFVMGWEINKLIESKPGGTKNAQDVFGHRGYTGTSIWINTKLNLGFVLLTNTSMLENGKNQLTVAANKNILRQKVSDYIWKLYSKPQFKTFFY